MDAIKSCVLKSVLLRFASCFVSLAMTARNDNSQ
jgi:hypothetical protein